MAGSSEAVVVPMEIRPSVRTGTGPLASGLLVATVGVVGALLFALLLDRFGPAYDDFMVGIGFATRAAILASLTTGYTLGVWLWIVREQHRDLAELGIERQDAERDDPVPIHAVPMRDLRRSRLAGFAGIAFFVATIEVPTLLVGGDSGGPWTSIHPLSYMLLLGVTFFWLIGRVAYFATSHSQFAPVFARLEIDLLDQRPLRVFGRMGLRNAFIWIAGTSIGALAFLNPELRISQSLWIAVPVGLAGLLVGTAAMLLPLRGIHARMRETKREELARVEAAIRGDAEALAASRIADRDPPPSLADLIAYRDLVEKTPEWPLDASSFRRLGLYLLIPIGSWIGGALMERAIGALLD